MFRICTEKETGRLIELQSGMAPLGTLLQNAVNAGFSKDAIEEHYITDQEADNILRSIQAISTEEKNILDEEKSLLRSMAIDSLKKQGKL